MKEDGTWQMDDCRLHLCHTTLHWTFPFSNILFWNPILMLLGASFLIASVIGLALFRRKMSIIKSPNPEAIEALDAEDRKRWEKEKALGMKDLPPWLIALLLVILVVSLLGELGTFRFSPILESSLIIVIAFLIVYYFLSKRKVKERKYPQTQLTLH